MTNEEIIVSLQSLKEYAYNTANQSNDNSVATNVTIRVNLRDFMFVMDEAISSIENLPSVTQQPKMGHWVDKDGISDFMYCSNCGGKKHYSEKWIGCPYCLADMREPYKGESIEKHEEQKIGHWIDSSNGWMCSECNRDNAFDTDYCPHCKAKMERNKERSTV